MNATALDDFDRANQYHTHAAILLLLEEVEPGEYAGIAGAIVYTAGEALEVPLIVESISSRDEQHTYAYKLIASATTAADAGSFVSALYGGPATIPNTDYKCTFALAGAESGFTSPEAHGWNQTGENHVLLSDAHWTRRHYATEKKLHGKVLGVGTVRQIVEDLPRNLPLRFRVLDLERRLEAIGDVIELIEPPVAFNANESDGTMSYELRVLVGPEDVPFLLLVRTYHGQLYSSVQVQHIAPGKGAFSVPSDIGRFDWELTRDGLLVHAFSSATIKSVGVKMKIGGGTLAVIPDNSGEEPVRVDIVPSTEMLVNAGRPPKPPRLGNETILAARAWRAELADQDHFKERVFTLMPPKSRREGLRYLADLIAEAVTRQNTKHVYIVDQFGIDRPALLRVAVAAAKVSGGSVHLLTRNLPPPSSSGAVHPQTADYEALARQVASRIGMRILRYTPTRDIHDRYLWIGDRVWHVGHSLNQLGSDVSAIIEIRSIEERDRLLAVLRAEFAQQPDAKYS